MATAVPIRMKYTRRDHRWDSGWVASAVAVLDEMAQIE